MRVYVVFCRYEGCEDCNYGAHVLGAFVNRERAEAAGREHEEDTAQHLHYFGTDVVEVEAEE